MKKIFLFLAFFTLLNTYSQETTDDDKVFNITEVDKEPMYIHGMNKFYRHMAINFKHPTSKEVSGVIIIQFIIEKDGSTSNLAVFKDIGYGYGDEAMRVFRKSKNWLPGEKDGQPIRTLYQLPLTIGFN